MADSVSAQKEKDLAVPLTWLCHPTLDSGRGGREGEKGWWWWGAGVDGSVARHRAAPCAVVGESSHVSLHFRLNFNTADNSADICNLNARRGHQSCSVRCWVAFFCTPHRLRVLFNMNILLRRPVWCFC